MTRETSVTGIVRQFHWGNPHAYIFLESEGHQWTLEIESPNLLRHQGWTKESLKPGEQLTCQGARAKDPARFEMKCFVAILPDGRKLQAQYRGEAPGGR
jgi:hypothetical protein